MAKQFIPAKLKPAPMFACPRDMEAFDKYLSKFSGTESIVALTAAMMAWNLASRLTNPDFEKEYNHEN